jgi:hypothetical protein
MIIVACIFSTFLTQVFNCLNIDLQKERVVADHLNLISRLNQITNSNRLSHLSYLLIQRSEKEREITYAILFIDFAFDQ